MLERLSHKEEKRVILRSVRKYTAYILWVALAVAIISQKSYAAPSKLITKFSFTLLTGGIIILKARVGHHLDSLNFVLDTGSGGISLDSSTVSKLQLTVQPSDRIIRGIAGMRKVSFVMNETLLLPGLLVDSLNFHINDYEILTSVYGIKIDGIIGYSVLSRYVVHINYDKHLIEFWHQGEVKYPKGGFKIKPNINNIPVFKTAISDATDITSRYYFDTGAGLCLLLSERFVADSNLLKKGKKITLTQAEGLGGKKEMRLTTIKQVEVGKYKFKKVPTYIFEDEFNITAYPQLGGVVGNDLLRRFNTIINYNEETLYLTPNTHFVEPFDYSYTGLGMYYTDGQIVIEDVIDGSPGQKAGLLPGDVVFSVGNNLSGNIQTYKTLLQTPKARLRIVINRDGQLMMKHIKVASILGRK